MATIKAFTDLEQSKKLAEILSIETADGTWVRIAIADESLGVPEEYRHSEMPFKLYSGIGIPSWSLAALLDVVSEEVSLNSFKDGNWNAMVQQNGKMIYSDADNPVDACVAMIEKLHEQNLL